jgi:hypothetical protein
MLTFEAKLIIETCAGKSLSFWHLTSRLPPASGCTKTHATVLVARNGEVINHQGQSWIYPIQKMLKESGPC